MLLLLALSLFFAISVLSRFICSRLKGRRNENTSIPVPIQDVGKEVRIRFHKDWFAASAAHLRGGGGVGCGRVKT